MSTTKQTIAALTDVLAPAGALSVRAMFGEYAIYLNGRVVALVCDDRLFIKPVPGAKAALQGAALAQPYPGARLHLLAEDALDDPDPAVAALRAAAIEVPLPAPKRGKPR